MQKPNYYEAWQPEFDTQNPYDGRKEQTPEGCPQTSTWCAVACTCPHRINVFKNTIKNKKSICLSFGTPSDQISISLTLSNSRTGHSQQCWISMLNQSWGWTCPEAYEMPRKERAHSNWLPHIYLIWVLLHFYVLEIICLFDKGLFFSLTYLKGTPLRNNVCVLLLVVFQGWLPLNKVIFESE